MTKVRRQPYSLDDKGIKNVTFPEIKIILRGADDLIRKGGRSLLAKILKGSRDKKVLEKKLNQLPSYGFFKDLKTDDILAKIDWIIINGYLDIEYDYRLPLLVYTEVGWEIEKNTITDELLEQIRKNIDTFDVLSLKDRSREMIFLLLDKILRSRDKTFIPFLEQWRIIDYKKVQQKIHKVISVLS